MSLDVFKDLSASRPSVARRSEAALPDLNTSFNRVFPITLQDPEQQLNITLHYLEALEERAHQLPIFRSSGPSPLARSIDPKNPLIKVVPQILWHFKTEDIIKLNAPTGVGKTTILSILLAAANMFSVLASPRRILTELAAERIAWHFGEEIGNYVGFAHGYERRCSPSNIIRCYTDSYLFVEQLLTHNPEERWPERTVVIVDEFHEGGLGVHFLLAELRRQQKILRRAGKEPFKVIVTSATLDNERLSETLNCPFIDVKTNRPRPREYMEGDRQQLASICHQEVCDGRDVMVLNCGKPEIEMVMDEIARYCSKAANSPLIDFIPLHSRSGPDARTRAAAPAGDIRRIIPTTIGRTGVTFDVHTVIDLGRVRDQATIDNIETLRLRPVTEAEKEQGYGRIGRILSDRRLRDPDKYILLTDDPERELLSFPQPEIERLDISSYVLRLAAANRSIRELHFVIPPSEARIAAAYEKLQMLQLFSPQNRITKLGRTVARIPLDVDLGVLIARAMAREKDNTPGKARPLSEAAVTMAAIIVNEGLQEQVRGSIKSRPWARECLYSDKKNEQSSDLLAQLLIYRAAAEWYSEPGKFKEYQVSRVAFERTRELRSMLLRRLDIPDRTTEIERLRAPLLEIIRQSFIHNVFVRDTEGWRDSHGVWKLGRFTVVGNNVGTRLITGIPQIVEGLDDEEHKVIRFATEVPVEWYRDYVSPAMKDAQEHAAAALKPLRRERYCNRVNGAAPGRGY